MVFGFRGPEGSRFRGGSGTRGLGFRVQGSAPERSVSEGSREPRRVDTDALKIC